MHKQRYMFITTTLADGGAERAVSILASSIAELGHKVCVIKYYETNDEYSVSDKVEVINLSGGCQEDYKKITYLKKVREIRRFIKTNKPDYIIPFLFQVALCASIAASWLKTTVIQTIRINPALGPSSKSMRKLRDILVYRSKCTFVQNEAQKLYFPKRYHKKIHVIFNPVMDEMLSAEWHPNDDEFIVCGVGRLEGQKNFKLLIDSFCMEFADIPKAVLRIYGCGSQETELKNYIENTGLKSRIQMMGRSHEIKTVYEKASLFVLSSDFEGMPNALIEAMAVGMPCISTDCPTGPSDLIQNGKNGLLVPVANAEAMADAMRSIYEGSINPYQLGAMAKTTIRELCSAKEVVKKMTDICSKLS